MHRLSLRETVLIYGGGALVGWFVSRHFPRLNAFLTRGDRRMRARPIWSVVLHVAIGVAAPIAVDYLRSAADEHAAAGKLPESRIP